MKLYRFRIAISLIIISLLMMGCMPTINVETTTTKMAPDTGDSANDLPYPAETDEDLSFSIQSDDELRAPVSALYEAFSLGKSTTFVESGADLQATTSFDGFEGRPFISATFLPNSVLIPQANTPEVEAFIAFSISPDGQQALIDAGHLPHTVTLTDQAGNTVDIKQPVRRAISSYGPTTAIIYSIRAQDRMVSASYLGARDPLGASVMAKIDPRFPELMGDDYFSQQDFNLEEAATLNPDLIISSARSAWLDSVEQLGIPIILFDAETPDRLRGAVLLMGEIFGPHAAAQSRAWVDYYDQVLEELEEQTAQIPTEERVRVLFTGTNPLRVASGEMYQTFIIEASGGISVTSELGGYWNDINLEQVVIWDPDVIIVPPYGGATVEAITESPEWQILESVEAGLVYQMPKLVVPWDTPAPDSVLGLVWMGQRLYPDRVDLDCSFEAEYFYTNFYDYEIPVEEIALICPFE